MKSLTIYMYRQWQFLITFKIYVKISMHYKVYLLFVPWAIRIGSQVGDAGPFGKGGIECRKIFKSRFSL